MKKGYINWYYTTLDYETVQVMSHCKEYCDYLVVGIMSNDLYYRMTDRIPPVPCEQIAQMLLSLKSVDEVLILDWKLFGKTEVFDSIHYDVVFYGTEYGREFINDRNTLSKYGVEWVSLIPEGMTYNEEIDPVYAFIQNIPFEKKLVLYGTGKYYDIFCSRYGQGKNIAYAIDSNQEKWGTCKNNIKVFAPEKLNEENLNDVVLLICARDYNSVKQDLKQIGDVDYRIMLNCSSVALLDEYAVIIHEENEYLKKAHQILMQMIKNFDGMCSKYGLKYYVISGSLIGVVRHQSLIPWDDDIDVAMTRSDYEILKNNRDEFLQGTDLRFVDYDELGEDAFLDFMTRLVYMKENIPNRVFRKIGTKIKPELLNKMVMDIYVLDNASENTKRHKKHTKRIKMLYSLGMGHRSYVDYSEYDRVSRLYRFAIRLSNYLGKYIPIKTIYKWYIKERSYAANEKTSLCFESDGVINYMPYLYDKDLYSDGIRMPLNNLMVSVPSNPDGLLKAKGYGNYMNIPQANCRKPSHSVKASGVIW